MVRLGVDRKELAFEGATFGDVGAYEYIVGKAFGSIDPQRYPDSTLANLDRAERDSEGLISYEAQISVLRPVDPARANGWLIFEPLNRGNIRAMQRFNRGKVSSDFRSAKDAGNGYLMAEGYTLAWCAWQPDVVSRWPGPMLARLPVAKGVQGWCTQEFLQETADKEFIVELTYPVADSSSCKLTARTHEKDPREEPAGIEWRLTDDRHLEVKWAPPGGRSLGTLFEFTYLGRDPVIGGAAYCIVRDVAAELKYPTAGVRDSGGFGTSGFRHALGLGVSLSARLLREFTYLGFDRLPDGRLLFDYLMPVISGSRKVSVDRPFSHANKFSGQHEGHSVPVYQPPFHYQTYTANGAREEGILDADRSKPAVIHVDSDAEYWQGAASHVVTDADGRDRPEDHRVRVYLVGGVPHGGSVREGPDRVAGNANLLSYDWLIRALLRAVRQHAEEDMPLPASRHPTVARGTLVPPEQLKFPKFPGLTYSGMHATAVLLNSTKAPPLVLKEYPTLVPAVDADGNTRDAVLHPVVGVPIATFTGWIPRTEAFGGPDLNSGSGSATIFALDKKERMANGDPRLSMAERYPSLEVFVQRIDEYCEQMVRSRYLLKEDAADIVSSCRRLGPTSALLEYFDGNAVAEPRDWSAHSSEGSKSR